MMNTRRCTLLALFCLVSFANCANILILGILPSPSHHIWYRAIAYGLAKEGRHNVTVLTPDTEKNPAPNVHYIHLESVYETLYGNGAEKAATYNMTEMVMVEKTAIEELRFTDFSTLICKLGLESTGIKMILNYPESFKFDVIIHDYTIGPCLLFLMERFNNPPLISTTAFLNPPYTTDIVGGHKHSAYIPFFNVNYDTNMNFIQRTYNTILYAVSYYYHNYDNTPAQDKIVRETIKWDFSYLGDIQKQTVLALVNTHPSFDVPEPLAPNVIPVGGLQIQEPKSLPNDLEEFLQAAPKGAVLFSLGTNVKSNELGAEVQIKLLKAFEQMPQYHFLWKFETDTLPMKAPKNVLIRPWLPQNDLLGHPKIVLFITHAGGLSTIEATWHGVPLVAIPFMIDQHKNAFKSVKSGVAEKISFIELSTDLVKNKVMTVIEDPSYRRKMKQRSARFRDQPEKPLDRALWWIEYILRNPKPDHIQSPTMKLGFIRSNGYDILATLVSMVLFVFYVLCKLIALCRGRKRLEKVKTH